MNNMIPSPTAARQTWLALLVGIVLSVTAVQAQTASGILAGRVRDGSGNPLASARVAVVNTNLEAVTERDGDYYLGTVPAGNYTVRVSYLGLPARDELVVVTAGERTTLDVRLGVADSDEVVQLEAMSIEGQRAGQARALNLQRASGNLRNIVAADAIGRFPDQNAAETMQRITGVSLERDQGEGRFISIRGVDPDLNNTQLNGINIPASQEDSRKVNLDVFPTDILDSIEVVKAITPDMDGDAIGGSVNVKTQTAFSADGRILRGSAEGQYNDLKGKLGYKYSAVWGDKFLDNKLGLLVSWSAAKKIFGSDNRETDNSPWVVDPANGGFIEPGGDIQHREYDVTRWRTGASFALDYRPDAENSYYVRGVYSRFSDYENRFRTRFRGAPARTSPTSNTSGNVTASRIQIDLKDRYEDNKVWSLSTGGEHLRGDWEIDYLAAWSLAKLIDRHRTQPVFRTGNTTFTYDISNPENPVFTGTGTGLAPSAYTFNGWALDRGFNDEEELTLAANFKRAAKFGAHDGHYKFGAKYRAKTRTVDISSDAVILASGSLPLTNFARFSPRGAGATIPSIDPAAFRAFYESNRSLFTTNANNTAVNAAVEDYDMDENILAAYAMAEVTLGKLTLIGGVRGEATDYSSRGFSVEDGDASTIARTSASRDYTTVLPGVVARYDFSRRFVGRASLTTTLARPKPLDSSSSRVVEDDDVFRGNPGLKPYRSLNFDASLEYYSDALGVFSVGVFHKDIRDFIYSEVLPGGGINGGALTTPLNGDSATVTGLEIEWQRQFTNLPAPFDGLGVFANLTLTDSESEVGGGRRGENVPFLNQSKTLYNLAVSYEKHGFFLRASLNHRSRYLSLLGSSTSGDQYVLDHTQLDISTNYRISPRYTVYAELLNVTEEPYRAVFNVTNGLRKFEYYSWTANVGVKINF
ncbi:MAG: TonB-dependent receptor [Verrucomicrobia bacterium]|nr:TonB-dependent receptor [Verrucomicrobiota bacterium]